MEYVFIGMVCILVGLVGIFFSHMLLDKAKEISEESRSIIDSARKQLLDNDKVLEEVIKERNHLLSLTTKAFSNSCVKIIDFKDIGYSTIWINTQCGVISCDYRNCDDELFSHIPERENALPVIPVEVSQQRMLDLGEAIYLHLKEIKALQTPVI